MRLRTLLQAFCFIFAVSPVAFSQSAQNCIDDFTIIAPGGATDLYTCQGDGVPDVIRFTTSTHAMPFGYLITDENNMIIEVSISNIIDFENLPPGNYRVWAFSWKGIVLAEPGQDATTAELASVCYELSNNFIPIGSIVPDGGTVSTTDGSSTQYTCPGDGNADVVSFMNTSSDPFYAYVITDEDNNILEIVTDGNSFDFENAPIGVCRVWGLSYIGEITAMAGENAATAVFADGCFDLSDNFVEIVRTEPDGGTVSLTNGNTEVTICENDPSTTQLSFSNVSTSPAPYVFVVTDEDNVIVAILDGNTFDFSQVASGNYRIWGLSFTGNATAAVGDDADLVALSDDCFDLSDNFVAVINRAVEGGSVSTPDGSTAILTCLNDDDPDVYTFITDSQADESYIFVITDDNNIILGTSETGEVDFGGAGAGVCRVWGLSYSGNLLAQAGDDAAAIALSDECFELSDNFVEVTRKDPNGGEVSLASGATSATVCVNDGVADELSFQSTGSDGEAFTFLITDENNVILALNDSGTMDFEGAGVGVCRIWGLAYTGTLSAQVGDDAAATALSDECFDLSDNFITVIRKEVQGGTVALDSGDSDAMVCVDDGVADELTIVSDGSVGESFIFVVTDENGIILATSETGVIDFEAAGVGTCLVWGLAYSGTLLAQVGDDAAAIALSDECYELSENFVTVVRFNADGGTVSLESGETEISICTGDGIADELQFTNADPVGDNFIFVITDDQNIILATSEDGLIDFEDAGGGVCRVWGLAFNGNFTGQIGDDAATAVLADQCFDLSDNFVEVTRTFVDGGTVSLLDGSTTALACVGNGVEDIFEFIFESTSSADYRFIVTDENNNILVILDGNMVNFDLAAVGICRVWGLSSTGNIIAEVGDDAAAVDLTDGCFELSANFVEITRENVDGGTVAMPSGETERRICPSDGNPDIVMFDSMDVVTNGSFTYVITDENNNILGIPSGDSQDFDGAGEGICRVWGLAYTGTLTAQVGDNAATVALSDGCFDLSDNFIEVIREIPQGGTVAMPSGATQRFICPGDGVPDIVMFDSTATSGGPYTYIITDDNNTILALPDGDSADFDGAGLGTCRVWGLAYTGNLTAEVGGNLIDLALSDDCFSLSDNYIEIVREIPEGGTVAMPSGATQRFTCPSDGIPDIVMFDSTGTSSGPYSYVITDENNIILALPDGDSADFDGAGAGICRVWGLAYTGTITAQVGDDAAAIALSDDCFDLSDNFIEVIRETPEGGTISSNQTGTSICSQAGEPLLISYDSTGTSAGPYAYVITDTANVIVAIVAGDTFDWSTLPNADYRVWGLAFTGNVLVGPGDDADDGNLTDDCFDLSDNFIETIIGTPEGGTITANGGMSELTLCVGDGNPDVVNFEVSGASDNSYVHIVTDNDGFIIGTFELDSFDFDNAVGGICRIYGMAYTGVQTTIPGDNIFDVDLASGCFDLTDDFITLNRQQVDGSIIFIPTLEDTVYVCSDDGIADLVTFNQSSLANDAEYQFVITFENNTILAFINGNEQDFDATGFGVLHVWGISYTGNLTAGIGDDITSAMLSDECFDPSDNFITIIRDQPEGGMISTSEGETDVELCVGAEDANVSFVTTSGSNAGYRYILTDTDDVIISVSESNSIDFTDIDPGSYHIWGLSFTGDLTVNPGEVVTAATLSTSCFELSDNFIPLFRSRTLDGGVVSNLGGLSEVYTCPFSPSADLVIMETTSTDTAYTYVVTDTLGNILVPDIEGNVIDFDNAAEDVYRIYGISYSGTFTGGFGDNVIAGELSDSCHAASSNFITVFHFAPDGGTVVEASSMGTTVETDGSEPVLIINQDASGHPYVFVLTNETGDIQSISTSGEFNNIGDLPQGIYQVWGVAYTGNLLFAAGDNLFDGSDLSDDCFDLSDNFVMITFTQPFTDGEGENQFVEEESLSDLPVSAKLQIAPNPVRDILQVQFDINRPSEIQSQVVVLNFSGQALQQQQMPTQAGENTIRLNVEQLSSGMYVVYVRNGDVYRAEKFQKIED